jgi:TonB-dependent starch-binding outer membrane protein SusC
MKDFTKNWCVFSLIPAGKTVKVMRIGLIMGLLFTISLFMVNAYSQAVVKGTVRDSKTNETIPRVNVSIAGTNQGTTTDLEGTFIINVPDPSAALSFSFVGYIKQEVMLNGRTELTIALVQDLLNLDEVVVIGYGAVKKSDLTGSVSVVSTKELTRNPSASAAQALQGKAPGVLVTQNGKPGGSATIRVRGVGSINRESDPIYILDGVQVGNIDGIQPTDIESMQVLKDASASAIYGANGSNGVIIITTKRGKSGKPVVNLNTYVGYQLAPKQYDLMNADQYSAFYTALYGAKPEYEQAFREKYYGAGWQQGTNWQKEMFKNGLNQNYNLSIAGGGNNSNFNVSFTYTKDDGTVIKSNANRYSIRANSDFKLGKHIKIGENFSMNYSMGEDPVTVQTSIWDLNTSPLMKVYNPYYRGGFESFQSPYWEDAEGNLMQGRLPDGYTGPVYINTLGNDKPNPLCAPSLGSNKNYNLGTNASVYLQIDFADWLSYKITPAAEIFSGRNKNWLPMFEGNRSPGQATLSESYREGISLNLENQLMFKKNFNEVHHVQATVVYQVRSTQYNDISATENGFDFEQLNTLTNGGTISKNIYGSSSDWRMLSYLGRVMYDYKGQYFVTASYRSDGVSVFAPAFRRGNFASASVAWKVNEVFFKDVKEIDALKLRLGWGQTGNSSIGGGFQYLDRISPPNNFYPVFGADQHIARAQYVFYGFASKEIHWEAAEMLNVGVDLSLFNSKLQSSLEYYVKNNKDLLVAIPISSAFGRIDGNPWFNTGNLQNRGVEFSLQWRDNVGDFNYGIITNFTTIKNEVKYLPVTDITTTNNTTIEGHSIGALYGYVSDGIIQLDESNYAKDSTGNWQKDVNGLYTGYKHATHVGNTPQPGDLRYEDLNGDGDVTSLDKTIIGKTIPSFTYTLGFDCSYKNFDFNIFLFGVNDFDIYNAQRASASCMNSQDLDHNKLNDFAENHWTLENASTEYVRVDISNRNVNDQISTFWIEDGSFLRIKDIQLGYSLSAEKCKLMGIASLRIYANASNLYCFTAYKGRDPEGFMSVDPLNSGTDYGNYPIPRSFTGGIQIGF